MEGTHRPVIFEILSEASGRKISAADLQESDSSPRPAFPSLNFDVNWTHSGGVCVVAYGEPNVRVRIGVDLEKHSPKHLRLAERFYHPDEVEFLKSQNTKSDLIKNDFLQCEFYRLWCRKEALYKCVGGNFFEGAVGRSVLKSPMMAGPGNVHKVFFLDLDGSEFVRCCESLNEKRTAGFPAALCVAVSSID